MTNFPNTKDNLPKPTGETKMNEVGFEHAELHTAEIEAIESLQNKVGIDDDTNTDSLDFKVKDLGVKKAGVDTENTFSQNQNFQKVITDEIEITGDTVQLSEGGTGANLTTPTEPKIFYNNGNETKFLNLGSGLELDSTTDTIKAVSPGLSVQGEFVDQVKSNFKFNKKQSATVLKTGGVTHLSYNASIQHNDIVITTGIGYSSGDPYIYLQTYNKTTKTFSYKNNFEFWSNANGGFTKPLRYGSESDIDMVGIVKRSSTSNSIYKKQPWLFLINYNGSFSNLGYFTDTLPYEFTQVNDIYRISPTDFKVLFKISSGWLVRTYSWNGSTFIPYGSLDVVISISGYNGRFINENEVLVYTSAGVRRLSVVGQTVTQVGQDSTGVPFGFPSEDGNRMYNNTTTYIWDGSKYVLKNSSQSVASGSVYELSSDTNETVLMVGGKVVKLIGEGYEDSIEDLGQKGHLKKMINYNNATSGNFYVNVNSGVNAGNYYIDIASSTDDKLVLKITGSTDQTQLNENLTEENILKFPYDKMTYNQKYFRFSPDFETGNYYIRYKT